MKVKVWDDGQTFDRYTIRIENYCYGMSMNPFSPMGFNQYCGDFPPLEEGDHLGKLLSDEEYKNLPFDVKEAIKERQQ